MLFSQNNYAFVIFELLLQRSAKVYLIIFCFLSAMMYSIASYENDVIIILRILYNRKYLNKNWVGSGRDRDFPTFLKNRHPD